MGQSSADKAAEAKAKGTQAFQNKEYEEAIKYYGEAISHSSSDHLLYSNRSASYAAASMYKEALADASKCIELKPEFAKGYSRLGYAQYRLNDLREAKKTYQEGLKHDSQSQALKDGLRDTQKGLRSWFLTVLAEGTRVQRIVQQKICEAIHSLVAEGCTTLSFLDALEKVRQLDLPQDGLEKHGLSEEELHQSIADYDKTYDYEVMTAVQTFFAPSGTGDEQEASKVEIKTLVDIHKFMEDHTRRVVEEFTALPTERKQAIPKKDRERAAELLASVAIESSFKIRSEDLELAVLMKGEALHSETAFTECQAQLGNLLQSLMDEPFNEKSNEKSSEKSPEQVLSSDSGVRANGLSSTGAIIISLVGLVVLSAAIRWKLRSK